MMDRQADARAAIARLEEESQVVVLAIAERIEARSGAVARATSAADNVESARRDLAAVIGAGDAGLVQRQQLVDALVAQIEAQGVLDRIDREARDMLRRGETIEGEIMAWRRHLSSQASV